MAVNLQILLTQVGKAAFWNAKNTGVTFELTHLQFGSRNRAPTGQETALVQPVQYVALTNGSRIDDDQVRISATMPANSTYDITEIGLWAGIPSQTGSVLFGYFSVATGSIAKMVSGINLVFSYDMVVSAEIAENLIIKADTDQSSTHALLAAHESNRNAHPFYFVIDKPNTVTGVNLFKGVNTFEQTIQGNISGNAVTATRFQTARTIGLSGAVTGTPTTFNGTANISIPVTSVDAAKLTGTAGVSTTGNAATATKLQTARTFSLTGDATASATFDGTGNLVLNAILANTGVAAGTYGAVTIDPNTTFIPVVQFDAKGRALKATNVPMKAASTAQYGLTKLNTATNSTSQTEAATPSAVKVAYDTAVNANTRSLDNKSRLDKLEPAALLHEESLSIPSADAIYVYKNVIGFQKKINGIKGALVLHLPVAKDKSTTMLGFKFKGYDYRNNSGIWELNVGGYSYSTGWLCNSAALHGWAPFDVVRLAQAADHQVIILGTEDTNWLYPMVILDELFTGYTNTSGWRDGFSFSFDTDLTQYTGVVTPLIFGTPRAQAADKLTFGRTIGLTGAVNGTPTAFDGSGNILIPVTSVDGSKLTGSTNINTSGSAGKLATPRTIGLTGAVNGTPTAFDGSGNILIPVTSVDASKLTGTANINTTGSAAKLSTPRKINGVNFDGTTDITIQDGTKVPLTGGNMTGPLAAPSLGVNNTDGMSGKGISLYGGAVAGKPNYGIYFAGTPTFGYHGDVSGPWATYFSVITSNDKRGWIFQANDINVASISTNGIMTANSFVGGLKGNADTATKLSAVRTISFNGDVTGSYGFDGSVNAFCRISVNLATTTQKGIVQLNNTLSSTAVDQALTAAQGKVLADTKANLAGATFTAPITAPVVNVGNSTYPTVQFSPTGATNGAILQMSQSGYPYFAIRPINSLGSSTGQIAFFGIPATKVGTHTFAMLSDIPDIVNNLTTNDASKSLSAAQGKYLNDNKVSHGDYGLGQTLNIQPDTLLADLNIQNSFWSRGSAPLPSDAPTGISAFKALNFGPSPWNSQIVVPAYENRMLLRSRVAANGVFLPWRELAFTDSNITGNAASASKLFYAPKINGITFNGTTDINVDPCLNEIPANADLNNYQTQGFNFCPLNNTAASLKNCPTTNAFSLLVEISAGAIQTIKEYMPNTGRTFRRHFYSGIWGAWYQIYSSQNPQPSVTGNAGTATKLQTARAINGVVFDGTQNITIYDASKLPLTGGTISGSLAVNGAILTASINGDSANLSILSGGSARGINVGQLLISNQYTDASKVPTNGGYIRGNLIVDGGITGNASTATKFATPRKINGLTFDGTADITISNLPITTTIGNGQSSVYSTIQFGNYGKVAGAGNANYIHNGLWEDNQRQIGISNYSDVGAHISTLWVGKANAYIKIGTTDYQLAKVTDNVASATKLATARTLSASGDGTWSVSFDGSANASGVFTLANSGVSAGTYQSVTVDAKGRVTSGQTVTTGLITSNAATGTTNTATSNTNTFLNVVENKGGVASSVGTSTQVTGSGSVTVSSDTAGKLVINGINTTYTAGNGLSLTGTAFSAKLLNVLTSTDTTSALTAAQGKVLKDTVDQKFDKSEGKVLKDTIDQKLDKSGGTIAGNLAVNGKFTLDQSNLEVVSGSGYQITYDYATRIATIEMTLFENKPVIDGMQQYSPRNTGIRALEVSLPIQLKKRLTEHFYISEYLEGQIPFYEEAAEWMFHCMPSSYRPYTKDANGAYVEDPAKRVSTLGESKVFILARRWSGDRDEPCNGYLRVTGFF